MAWRSRRIGGVLRSMLMFICGSLSLAGAALILEPNLLMAVTKVPQPTSYSQRMYNEFAESLAALIGDCIEVLAINNHSPASQASVVLWKTDDVNPGVIDPQELVVISHSQLLRTITVYTLQSSEPREREQQSSGVSAPGEPLQASSSATVAGTQRSQQAVTGTPHQAMPFRATALRLNGPLDREAIAAPVFCDRWRATPAVKPRTIGTGISDLRIEPLTTSAGRSHDFSVLNLWLRWASDSADGAGEATAVIIAGKPREE